MPTPGAEVHVDVPLVRALLADQHPDLADRSLTVVASGWDNVLVRIGPAVRPGAGPDVDLAVRLPRRAAAAALALHEQRWLPEVARLVGDLAPVPVPVRTGRPALGFPWSWSVVPWFPGETIGSRTGGTSVAETLAAFLAALHVPAPADAPVNPVRAVPLHTRTEAVATRLASHPVPRAGELATAWRTAADLPGYAGPPVWVHGDLHPFNLLVETGPTGDRLSAVVDFGDVTAGDPAVDLATAWLTFDREARADFRGRLTAQDGSLDPHAWGRARGWAVSIASALAVGDEPSARAVARRAIDAALDD
ncbi:aminoglycoside phosphotransferase family protein [Curtobacterium sp. MCSS17_015]|uniref:aminoglycoside phosphotransferase family protein n=1 Tax=Curtobacterium sp. MCSS17_015 TaxID=2175666 RepID=UPI0021AC32AC|nr:aminoglycoside phosphotransferase family protein [Curtobacterium sp. MCSS17_015]WIB26416.1 aminoglycoside phosphotransferase family protein [Curtobacterium sp. MCSS17_015]